MYVSFSIFFILSSMYISLFLSFIPNYAALLTAYILYYFTVQKDNRNKDVLLFLVHYQHIHESRKNILYFAILNLLCCNTTCI